MRNQQTFLEALQQRGISRRSFLKFAAITASSMALSGKQAKLFAANLANAPRPTVIWLSFQQCTGCSESILRSFNPTIESLILGVISLDYHETLQVAAGDQAEKIRKDAMATGGYVLIVDGSIPRGDKEFWSCAAGNSNLKTLNDAVNGIVDGVQVSSGAGLVIALGTCAAFGGVAAANPNPTNTAGYGDLVKANLVTKVGGGSLPPYINISGCPPMAEVITSTIAGYLANAGDPTFIASLVPRNSSTAPSGLLDANYRPAYAPIPFYGTTVHSTCYRLPHWEANEFALSHGDDNAKKGYCLLHLGCRGPEVYNACTSLGWNVDPADNPAQILKNSPMHTGHGCIGCAEPFFWDQGPLGSRGYQFSKGFYTIQK